MKLGGFHHLAIQVNDLEGMAAFYRDVLGLCELARRHRADGTLRAIWLQLPGGGFIALEQVAAKPAPLLREDSPGYLLFALTISKEARQGILEELARRGVGIVRETKWTLYVRDPEGNQVGLSHYPEDPLADLPG